MAIYDLRAPVNYSYGQLSAGVTNLDTTLTSPQFASLPSDLTTTRYLPITLADDGARRYETVWVTGHGAGASVVTVVRAREATAALSWATGSAWRCAPTSRDTMLVTTRAGLPSDAHLGMRAALSDELRVVEKTASGWAASAPHAGGRRHSWLRVQGGVAATGWPVVTGFNADPANATIATQDRETGALLLNQAGVWAILLYQWGDLNQPRMSMAELKWTGGAWEPTFSILDDVDQTGGFWNLSGTASQVIQWTGYVSAAEAAAPIYVATAQRNDDDVICQVSWYLSVELLGG